MLVVMSVDRARGPALAFLASLTMLGCFSDSGIDDDFMDVDTPPGGCDATGSTGCPNPGSDGSELGGPCLDSEDCAGNGMCAAEFDGEVQSFTCRDTCIPAMDDARWCADDQACCAGLVCSARGYCLPPGDTEGVDESGTADTSGTAGSDSTSTASDASTGTTGASTGDAGTSSGTG